MIWCEKAEQFWYSVFNRNNLVINFSIFNSNIAIVLIKVDIFIVDYQKQREVREVTEVLSGGANSHSTRKGLQMLFSKIIKITKKSLDILNL